MLAAAIEAAAKVAQWDVVTQLARELRARRIGAVRGVDLPLKRRDPES